MKDPKMDVFTYRHSIDEKRAVELMSFAVGKVRVKCHLTKKMYMCYDNNIYFCCIYLFAEILIDKAKRERKSLSMEDKQ